MKKHLFLISMIAILIAETAAFCLFASRSTDSRLDAVAVNEAVRSVQESWRNPDRCTDAAGLDYVVLDTGGNILLRTRAGLSENIHDAIVHRDTILELEENGQAIGSIIIYNDSIQARQKDKKLLIRALAAAVFLQCGIGIAYTLYLEHTIIQPFRRLRAFAERVAGGNLDIPLEMDRQNLFGAFTESFDLMRSELKRARTAEAEANAGKKELVAKLSHDIRTPIASIKAAAEVGAALAESERLRDNYTQIIRKTDQINTLVTNLFTSALEELTQLSVTPADLTSDTLHSILKDADYLHRAGHCSIPDCLLFADPLRLQQVFDNIFANSYKYAATAIHVSAAKEHRRLVITIEDYGGGVPADELPFLKDKFRRGSNAAHLEGAGLGLYISDYFMKEMHGELLVQNGERGLRVCIQIALSGTV